MAVARAAAHLGGEPGHTLKVGAEHAANASALLAEYTLTMRYDQLSERRLTRLEVGGVPLLLARPGTRVCGLSAAC